ncbi:Peptidase propeptide and YPEB domain-containing protein [Terribacillus saccharophilus]|uniref:Peptidase propeptide and YPEB domain-containing protein n=1 Tax=Terribacillus saccharophilus TaxID=361277 RepID=A0AAX2ECB1_9BACI|nr:Peptidase propeptide and YPEB domain-containing protein [Terribacillus saccharophilus]
MKKKWIIPAAVVVLIVAVFGIYQMQASAGEPEMTIEQARQQAEKQYNATVTEIELDRSGSEPRYDIDLENGEKLYDLSLNGNTGEVISLKESNRQVTSPNTDQSQASGDDQQQDENKKTADDQQQSDKEQTAPSQKQASQAEVKISMDEAIKIATDEVGGSVTDAEFDEEDGLPVYELELKTADDEAEVVINAQSGEIITIAYDSEED